MLSRGAFLTATLLGVAIGLAFGHDFSTSWEPSISALHGTNFTPFHRNFTDEFAVKRLHNAAARPCCLAIGLAFGQGRCKSPKTNKHNKR